MNKKIFTIGYLTPSFFSSMRLYQYLGVIEGAREFDINLICFSGSSAGDLYENDWQANRIFDLVTPSTIDGLLCWTNGLYQKNPYLDIEILLSKNKGLPFVCLGRGIKDFPSIIGNDYLGAVQLITHFVEVHKYRKIAIIRGPEIHGNTIERYKGFYDTLSKYNIPIDERLISPYGAFNHATGKKGIEYFFDQMKLKPGIDIEAIVTPSDLISIGAIHEMKQRGIKVPKDVAVAGFNNRDECLELSPQLTSIDLQFFESGKTAVKVLMSVLNKKKVQNIIYIPSKLVVRESCGCMPAALIKEKIFSLKADDDSKKIKSETIKNKITTELHDYVFEEIKASIPAEWIASLINSLIDEIFQGQPDKFMETLNEIFEEILKKNLNINIWQNIITKTHSILLNYIKLNELIYKADIIFQNARILIFQKLEQSITINKLKYYRDQVIFPAISSIIVTTFDTKTLLEIIEKELPKLGINACYMALYVDPQKPQDKAKLIMAFDENGHIDINKYDAIFPSTQLFPKGLIPPGKKFEIIAKPLFFQDNPIGFILFRLENIDSTVYFALRTYISSALQGAFLVSRIEERSKELEQAYKNLQDNQKKMLISEKMASLGRLTAGIAHEMNTPLAAIRNAVKELDILTDEYALSIDKPEVSSEDHKLISQEMKKNIKIALQSIDKSIGFIRGIKSQTYNLSEKSMVPFNATNIVRDNLNLLENLFIKSKCRMTTELEENLYLFGDPKSINPIVTNLIFNAVDACKPMNTKEICVIFKKINEDTATLIIKDTGHGIKDENASKIFDPFFTTKPFGEGAGLGLSIVHEFVSEFDGSIEVKSKPGETMFTINFPVRKDLTAGF